MEAQHISHYLPEAQKEGQVTTVSKQLKTGDTDKLEIALQSTFIKDASFEEIKERLRLVMVKLGLRAQNLPNDLEKLVLVQHIQENFGGNNLDEIRLAFDMAIAGKLDLKSDEVKCYENFSCVYFSLIMNAYRKWSAEEYRQVAMKVEPLPPQRIFTQDELDDGEREDVERQYTAYLKGYDLKGIEFNKRIALKDGLVSEHETIIDLFRRAVEKEWPHIYIK